MKVVAYFEHPIKKKCFKINRESWVPSKEEPLEVKINPYEPTKKKLGPKLQKLKVEYTPVRKLISDTLLRGAI